MHPSSGQQKLDKISLYSKNAPLSALPIKEVNFAYNYELCKQTLNSLYENSQNPDQGKLTLKKISFSHLGNTKGSLSPYYFDYHASNPNENPNYAILKEDAKQSVLTYDVFMKTPDKVIASLERIKKGAEDFLENNSINHTAHNIAEQMKFAKLFPAGTNLDFLNKYRIQLTAEHYRAVDAYKQHCLWRAENFEIEVVEEAA